MRIDDVDPQDKIDTVTMDVPLLIRMFEYAREDAKSDMEIHTVTERLIRLAKSGSLSMKDYNNIVDMQDEG
jgi:ArsR family metal-binding transcriptional regulator